jgi:hypothetical protein
MRKRSKSRRSRVPDILGGKLFGGSRRTARDFVTVVGLVFALVGVLVLQTWLRVAMVETMKENRRLEKALADLEDRLVCRETEMEKTMSRELIVRRARMDLGLRSPEFDEVVFVPDSSRCDIADRGREDAGTSRQGEAL